MGTLAPILWVHLLACDPAKPADPGVEPGTDPGTDIETGSERDSDTAPEQIDPAIPAACPGLLDPEAAPFSADVLISPEAWGDLLDDYARGRKEYHPIQLLVTDPEGDPALQAGEVVDGWIRLKGNPNFSWYTEKMQFVVSFNELPEGGDGDSGARFHGLRKLTFDASWYEPTLLRERVAWSVMRRAGGLPTACVRSAQLSVNGELYGAYASIEYFDQEWLERNFGADSGGALWKYGQEVTANEEAAVGGEISDLWRTTDPDQLAQMGDAEEWLRAWAAEAVLGDDDGYWCCAHNFYLYQHPTEGILFVPWDFDDILEVTPYDSDPVTGYPNGPFGLFRQEQFLAFAQDPGWRPRYVDAVEALNEAMDPDIVLPEIDAWQAQVRPLVEADPTRPFVFEEHDQTVDRMRAFVSARHAFLKSWIACERGAAGGADLDGDGDGYAACEDRDDGRADIYPGAPELCDGRDNDQDGVIDDGLDDGTAGSACSSCLYHGVDDQQYLFCREPLTFDQAEARCQDSGGHLGYPTDTATTYLVWFHAWPVLEPWWLGATDAAEEGRWVDMEGTSLRPPWGGGEPSGGAAQNCAAWDGTSFSWTAEPCEDRSPFICRL